MKGYIFGLFFKEFMEEAEAARISKGDTRKKEATERKNNRNFYKFFFESCLRTYIG